ncbi:MAG: hypothetical protein HY774_23855 [Acidobacteria bacterium]|nr:hypothetical protein [Acidobacteriota bacterium]
MTNHLNLAQFREHLHTDFAVQISETQSINLKLNTIQVRQEKPTCEEFSLTFLGPLEYQLIQQTLHLSHPVMGELDIFIVPVSRDQNGISYEAVFYQFLNAETGTATTA